MPFPVVEPATLVLEVWCLAVRFIAGIHASLHVIPDLTDSS